MKNIVENVLKEDFSNLEDSYVTVTVDLNYADKKNINGWRMPFCGVKKALETERIKELMGTGCLSLTDGYRYENHIHVWEIPQENIIGHTQSIDLENRKAIVSMSKKYKEEIYDKSDMCLSIAWLGNIKDGLCLDPTIQYTAMSLKEKSAYR